MKYKECNPIRPRHASVWEVAFPARGLHHVIITHKDMSVEEVVTLVKIHHPDDYYTVRQIDVGEYVIQSVVHTYSSDGRRIDQNLDVVPFGG